MSRYKSEIFLGILVFVYVLCMSYFSIKRHHAFASSYDLANMDQTIWNSSRGRLFTLSGVNGTVSRFQFHADLLLVLIAPIYWIVPKVEVLLFFQSLIVGLAAIPVYLIGNIFLKDGRKALLVSVTFLLNAGVMWANIYDFHSVTLSITFLLFAIYFVMTKNTLWVWVFSILSLLTKENMGVYLLLLGAYSSLVNKKKDGYILGGIGVMWSLIMILVVMPKYATNNEHWAWSWFSFGSYRDFLKQLYSRESLDYLSLLLKFFGYIPILGLPWLLFSMPDLIMNMVSSQGQMRSIYFHYDGVVLVGLVLSAIMGWSYFNRAFSKYGNIATWIPGIIMLSFALRTNFNYGPLPYTPSHWKPMYTVTDDEIAFDNKLKSLPVEASITSSSEVRGHITHRENSYNLPNMVGKTDYIAIVDQNRIVGDYEPKEFETGLIKKLLSSDQYVLEFHQGHFYLFKKLTDENSQRIQD